MERTAELIKHLDEEVELAIGEWVKRLAQINTTNIKEDIKEVFKKARKSLDPDSQIVITYLRSSAITESHKFKLAVYQGDPFISDPTYHALLDMKLLFTEVPNDLAEKLIKKLSPTYIQILPSEIEEIRRHFIIKLYQQSYHFFERILTEINDKQTIVYFGEEMCELIELGAN